MTLALLAAAPKGPLDTWSPTLFALFALLLPLIALLVIVAFTIDSRRLSAAIAFIFTLATVVCALIVVAIELAHPLHLERNGTFLTFFTGQSGAAQQFTLQWGVLADPLAAVMLLTVALVSLLIQVYALASIRREDGPIRFFSVLLPATGSSSCRSSCSSERRQSRRSSRCTSGSRGARRLPHRPPR